MASSAPCHARAADEADQGGALAENGPAAGVEVAEIVGGRRGRDPGEDARRGLEKRDLEPLLAQDGGRFEADVAAADDQRPTAPGEGGGERVGVGQRPHQKDAAEIAADPGRQAARRAAGREREEVVGQHAAVGEGDGAGGAVDGGGRRAGEERDAFGLEEARRPQEQPFERHLALEIPLGERRPLVGEVRLAADQRERAGVAEGAELRHQRGPGLARAHHDDPRCLRLHLSPFPSPSVPLYVAGPVLQPR